MEPMKAKCQKFQTSTLRVLVQRRKSITTLTRIAIGMTQRSNDVTRRYNVEFTPALVVNGHDASRTVDVDLSKPGWPGPGCPPGS